MTDVAEIARGLTKAQRETIANTRGTHEDGNFWFPLGSARGIPTELKTRTVIGHCLTPLGLAVRAHLTQEQPR